MKENFFEELRKQLNVEYSTEVVKMVIEGDWEEYINDDHMHPIGATKRILTEQSSTVVSTPKYLFQALITLFNLNIKTENPSWDILSVLRDEIKSCMKYLTEEELCFFEKDENFNRNEFL